MNLDKKNFKKNAVIIWAFFLDLIFPVECFCCGKDGDWLCAGCFSKLEFRDVQHCLVCKKESAFGQFCRACRSEYNLRGILIAGNYEDELLSKLVKALKYKFVRKLSKDIGKFLILFLTIILRIDINNLSYHNTIGEKSESRFEQSSLEKKIQRNNRSLGKGGWGHFLKNALIIPVPLHPRRERWRGFNQAELIARHLSDYFNLEINVGELSRVKHKKPQTKLSKKERKNNVKNCFAWRSGNLSGRNIILVDDVATTGATLNECASVLKKNGAGEIWGLAAANG